jgi:hypothetical protein
MVEMDQQFFGRVNAYLDELPQKLNIFTLPKFEKFVDPSNQRLVNLRKHFQAIKITQQQQAKLALRG